MLRQALRPRAGATPARLGKKAKKSLPRHFLLIQCRESFHLWSCPKSQGGIPRHALEVSQTWRRPMSTIGDILSYKGSHVLSIGKGASVMDAAVVMNEHKVGAVVVADEGRLVGMFTERDVLRRVVGERRDPA